MHVSAHMCWHKLEEKLYLERITGSVKKAVRIYQRLA
jgi:hypothetical protein